MKWQVKYLSHLWIFPQRSQQKSNKLRWQEIKLESENMCSTLTSPYLEVISQINKLLSRRRKNKYFKVYVTDCSNVLWRAEMGLDWRIGTSKFTFSIIIWYFIILAWFFFIGKPEKLNLFFFLPAFVLKLLQTSKILSAVVEVFRSFT